MGGWDAGDWERVWIYRKHFDSSVVAGGRVFIDFQGVMARATVFLAGVQVAEHDGGYLPWVVELTPHVVAGDNVLAVVVDARWLDVPPAGDPRGAGSIDFLQPGGIYRDVTLRVEPEVFISDVFAMPIDVLGAAPSVDIEATIDAASVPPKPLEIEAELFDGSRTVADATGSIAITATGSTSASLTITGIGGVKLWSPDHPALYGVRVTLRGHGGKAYSYMVRTGFRTARFEPDGFYLNGKRLQIFGLNRHQLFPYVGMAASARLQRRDAELLRNELNCNMVRCSHYPQSPDFLDACDELGLMVWEEPPGWQYVGGDGFQQLAVENVNDMVLRDRNRPSVIVWATRLNETSNQTKLYQQTRQRAHRLDGSRQSTGAMNRHTVEGWAEDVFAYDDYHSAGGNAQLLPPLPGVPYLVSEAVGAIDGPPLYRWIDTSQKLALQAKMHAQVHDLAGSNSGYAGLLGWAAIDYGSLSGGNRNWKSVKWPGVLDIFRVPKPGAAFYRSQLDPAMRPIILPVFFWDFGTNSPPNGPGPGAMIATNCERLELYLDSQPLTTATPDTKHHGHLAHPPVLVDLTVNGSYLPELCIDGYLGGEVVSTVRMSADHTRDQLALAVEDPSIEADGSDMTRITFRALDAYGNQRPYPGGDVTLSLSGPATLIGDNPFPFATYGGVGGAFVRSKPAQAGTVTITAQHPTLGQTAGRLIVTPPQGRGFI